MSIRKLRSLGILSLCATTGGLSQFGCGRPAPAAPAAPASEPMKDRLLSCAAPVGGPARVEEAQKLAAEKGFPSASCQARALALLDQMSLDEKIGQMTQPNIDAVRDRSLVGQRALGSVLSGGDNDPPDNEKLSWAKMVADFEQSSQSSRLKIPLLYGIDAVHGHSNVSGAVIFPHNIGLGATRDADLIRRIGEVTAREVRATGIDWTFAPVVAAAQDERWGRTYEAYGESHQLSSALGVAMIHGLQGKTLGGPHSVLACAKHFVGDGNTRGGVDRGEAVMQNDAERELLIESYRAAVEANVGTVMVSFSSLDGVHMHCNGPLITDILKRDLGFTGFVVTDWTGIDRISEVHYADKLTLALNAGVDMVMNPKSFEDFDEQMRALIPERVSEARVDDAVYRILSMKCEAGLFEPEHVPAGNDDDPRINHELLEAVGSPAHRAVAQEAVRKSLVLLKNEQNALPLPKFGKTILVTGRAADDLGRQCGGWTIDWQGGLGPITDGTTILEGIKQLAPEALLIESPDGVSTERVDSALVLIGEDPYAEDKGDSADLKLHAADLKTLAEARKNADQVIVVLVTGRPLIITPLLEAADAILVVWLPGSEGQGVAEVLFGDYAPTGKLSHSWPRSLSQLPLHFTDASYDPLFPYGFGLTYQTPTLEASAKQ